MKKYLLPLFVASHFITLVGYAQQVDSRVQDVWSELYKGNYLESAKRLNLSEADQFKIGVIIWNRCVVNLCSDARNEEQAKQIFKENIRFLIDQEVSNIFNKKSFQYDQKFCLLELGKILVVADYFQIAVPTTKVQLPHSEKLLNLYFKLFETSSRQSWNEFTELANKASKDDLTEAIVLLGRVPSQYVISGKACLEVLKKKRMESLQYHGMMHTSYWSTEVKSISFPHLNLSIPPPLRRNARREARLVAQASFLVVATHPVTCDKSP